MSASYVASLISGSSVVDINKHGRHVFISHIQPRATLDVKLRDDREMEARLWILWEYVGLSQLNYGILIYIDVYCVSGKVSIAHQSHANAACSRFIDSFNWTDIEILSLSKAPLALELADGTKTYRILEMRKWHGNLWAGAHMKGLPNRPPIADQRRIENFDDWHLRIILQHAQTPGQGQCFEISQTTNPKPS